MEQKFHTNQEFTEVHLGKLQAGFGKLNHSDLDELSGTVMAGKFRVAVFEDAIFVGSGSKLEYAATVFQGMFLSESNSPIESDVDLDEFRMSVVEQICLIFDDKINDLYDKLDLLPLDEEQKKTVESDVAISKFQLDREGICHKMVMDLRGDVVQWVKQECINLIIHDTDLEDVVETCWNLFWNEACLLEVQRLKSLLDYEEGVIDGTHLVYTAKCMRVLDRLLRNGKSSTNVQVIFRDGPVDIHVKLPLNKVDYVNNSYFETRKFKEEHSEAGNNFTELSIYVESIDGKNI